MPDFGNLMPGLNNTPLGSSLKSPSKQLGNKNNLLSDNNKTGTVTDMVEAQNLANELLQGISEKISSLGGDGDSLLESSGDSESSGLGDSFKESFKESFGDAAKEKFAGFMSDKLGSNKLFSDIFSKIEGMGGSMEGMSGSMEGMSDSAGTIGIVLQIINKVLEVMRGLLSSLNDIVEKGITQNIENQKQYLGPISSRLQNFSSDSATYYKDLSFQIRNVFTNSRFINQQQMLANLSKLVETGVGYNLEDRAYLMTIADRTVSTFDMLDASLTRMIRLQQSDLSRPQMGLEGYLTKGLNSLFQDTSYLSNMYDTVTSALLDATSQMSYDETTSYLYNVQKWLGSLYSVGMSESAIQTIAQGLNLLGSGNVSQLTGNDQLNTLFAMSAQRAGLSYAQLLTTGVSDDNVDKLLRAMIEYLQSIAENTSSEVLRNEYGRIFGGFSVSDIRAIQNLTPTDIGYIDTYKLDYNDAFKEVGEQVKLVESRTSVAEQVENMFGNLIYSIGSQVGESEQAYTRWVYANIAEELGDAVGGVIPGIIGDIFSNAVGVVTEGIKTGDIFDALRGKFEDQNGRRLQMFDGVVTETVEQVESSFDNLFGIQEGWSDFGTTVFDIFSGTWVPKLMVRMAATNASITEGLKNWDVYSRAGALDPIMFGENWSQFIVGERANSYSSSISLAENAFEESEAKIKAASEEITGIDDTVAKSLDSMYDSLFGETAKPIKVMVVDIDGNLLGSTTTNQFTSNYDAEENIGNYLISTRQLIGNME